jgi:endothelin-converting enzyme
VDEQNFNKAKTAYDACMDTEVLDMLGAEPLSRVLRHIARLFPVQPWATADVAKSPDVRDVILNLSRLRVTALVSLQAETDGRDPGTVVVSVTAPTSVGLPTREHYLDKELVENYRAAMSNVLSVLSPHHVRGDATRIVELEKRLALVSPSEDQHGITVSIALNFSASNLLQSANNPISLDDASALCPEIDLRGIVNALAGPTDSRVQRVIVKQPAYLESLSVI